MTEEFAPKKIVYDNEMSDILESGVKEVHDAVGRTMGPDGQLVMYDTNTDPIATKDGVSVASMIAFSDPIKNNGAQLVIQAARRQVAETGDGTTLTSILTYKIFKEGRKLIAAGYSKNEIIEDILKVSEEVYSCIEKQSMKDLKKKDLFDIAKVAISRDEELAGMIAEAMDKTGEYGLVGHEGIDSEKHELVYQDGYQIKSGIKFKEFANTNGQVLDKENIHLLITDKIIVDGNEILPILDKLRNYLRKDICEKCPDYPGDSIGNYRCAECEEGPKAELIIISPSVGGDIMQVMKKNVIEDGEFFLCHITPSQDFKPEKNKIILEDIAALSGGFFVSQDSGIQLKDLKVEQLGFVKRITSGPGATIFQGFLTEETKNRIEFLKEYSKQVDDHYIKDLCEVSIAKLNCGIAVVRVGGKNFTEREETMFRVDDAIRACKSAREMGYVRGGGISMLIASQYLYNCDLKRKPGETVILESIKYPAEVILKNANRQDWQRIIQDILTKLDNKVALEDRDVRGFIGYDIKTGEAVDMYEINVIDPAKVLIYALKNAVSVVVSLLKTSVTIVSEQKMVGEK